MEEQSKPFAQAYKTLLHIELGLTYCQLIVSNIRQLDYITDEESDPHQYLKAIYKLDFIHMSNVNKLLDKLRVYCWSVNTDTLRSRIGKRAIRIIYDTIYCGCHDIRLLAEIQMNLSF
jgi:hypothetical protein